MIEQGQIQEMQERTIGPMTAVINQYRNRRSRQNSRATRQKRDFHTVKEQKAIKFYDATIEKLEALNG